VTGIQNAVFCEKSGNQSTRTYNKV